MSYRKMNPVKATSEVIDRKTTLNSPIKEHVNADLTERRVDQNFQFCRIFSWSLSPLSDIPLLVVFWKQSSSPNKSSQSDDNQVLTKAKKMAQGEHRVPNPFKNEFILKILIWVETQSTRKEYRRLEIVYILCIKLITFILGFTVYYNNQ